MKKFTDLTIGQYLEELSSAEPVPGGGSVSAYVAALGMGLSQMVARVALGRKKKPGMTPTEENNDAAHRTTLQKIADSLEETKRDAFQIVEIDPKIYQEVIAASGNAAKMEDALQNSFRLQADLALLIVMAREWNAAIGEIVKGSIANDLVVSAGLLEGAFQGAYHTAMINVKYMKDTVKKQHAEKALTELKDRFGKGNAGAR